MTPSNQTLPAYLCRVTALITITTGLLVMAGWIFDLPFIRSLSPQWVTMKFVTALSFVLTGLIIYNLRTCSQPGHEKARLIVLLSMPPLLLIHLIVLFSILTGVYTGIEELFVKDIAPVMTVVPGRPSLLTSINFLLISICAIAVTLYSRSAPGTLRWLGGFIAIDSAIALIGYLINVPALYYYTPTLWGTGMAANTSILFLLIGLTLAWQGRALEIEGRSEREKLKENRGKRGVED